MNLLLLTNLFPTPIDPERGVFTLQLVKRLNKICNVTVICPLPYFPKYSFLKGFKKYYPFSLVPNEYIIDGIKVYSPKYPLIPKLSESKHAFLMSLGIKGCIKRLHNSIGFDAVNSQWLYPDSCAVDLSIQNLDLPHIPTGLGCDVNLDLHDVTKKHQIKKMLDHASAITVVSNGLKNELIESGYSKDKISVIPNGVDVSQFNPISRTACRQDLNIDSDIPVVLYVGRLSHEKCVSSLITSSSKLINKQQPFHLYIVGDGPLMDTLKEQAKTLKISAYVHFIGNVEHHEISKWMGACDYFSLPSLREGCPNVVLEALGCGRPVIASHVGAIPDVVNNDTGILFEPNNINSITAALEKAFATNWDPEIISNSVKKLSWEHAADKYYKVFESVIKDM